MKKLILLIMVVVAVFLFVSVSGGRNLNTTNANSIELNDDVVDNNDVNRDADTNIDIDLNDKNISGSVKLKTNETEAIETNETSEINESEAEVIQKEENYNTEELDSYKDSLECVYIPKTGEDFCFQENEKDFYKTFPGEDIVSFFRKNGTKIKEKSFDNTEKDRVCRIDQIKIGYKIYFCKDKKVVDALIIASKGEDDDGIVYLEPLYRLTTMEEINRFK